MTSLPEAPSPIAQSSVVPGWDALIDGLRGLPDTMMAMLPEDRRNDPQLQQDIGRLALAALCGSALDTLSADGDHPFFLPQLNPLFFAGQPNPDTIYRFTHITPGGTYRLRGRRGSLNTATIGQMIPRKPPTDGEAPTPISLYHDIKALSVDDQDRFDVILSPERPAGHEGDWWQLHPATFRLLMRFVNADWANQREPTVAIERVDAPANRRRPSAEESEAKLHGLLRETAFLAPLFVAKPAQLRGEGYVNRLKIFDVSGMGGLSGQFYYEGPFELEEHEALILEAPVPRCDYRSIMVTNETYDTIDWYNNHSALNGNQSQPDSDGILRYVVSARDPGVANWLDTAGHRRGLIQGRWLNADIEPVPTARKVHVDEVVGLLPADTPRVSPEERDRIIRDRRAALHQRSLW